MNEFSKVYKVTLKYARAMSKKRLRENERCYDSLKNKDTDYARVVKAIQDLHRQSAEIYANAADDIFEDEGET